MSVKFSEDGATLKVFLSGEIDHHSAAFMRDYIDKKITVSKAVKAVLDFNGVTFMDSSAIGLVMGRCRTAKSCGCSVAVSGLSERQALLMKMAGLDKIIEFEV